MDVEYLLSNASYVICFGSLHLVVFKEKCFPQCCMYFFIYFLYFNVFKQVNFVEFTHLPKFLISAIQARGFACRASVWGCGRERLGGRKRCYLSYWLLLHFFHLSLSVQ